MKKRLLSILTALALCLSLLTVTALPASDPGKLMELSNQKDEVETQLMELMEQWEQLSAQLEEMQDA